MLSSWTLILSDLQLLEVEIVRDDVAEKQQKILELTRQKDEMEVDLAVGCSHVMPLRHLALLMQALLREARSKIESYDEQPKEAARKRLDTGNCFPRKTKEKLCVPHPQQK